MTRNDNTSYRTKGRAVFLAALMVLSVVAVSVAFSGGAAAKATVPQDYAGIDNTIVQQGEDFSLYNFTELGNATKNSFTVGASQVYLVEVTATDSSNSGADRITGSNTVRELDFNSSGNGVLLDTSDLNGEYFLSDGVKKSGQNAETFEVNSQALETSWGAETYNQRDADAELTIEDPDGNLDQQDIAVRADGLSYDQLKQLFAYNDTFSELVVEQNNAGSGINNGEQAENIQIGTSDTTNVVTRQPFGTIDALDEDDRDDFLEGASAAPSAAELQTDVEDENVLTLNMSAAKNMTNAGTSVPASDQSVIYDGETFKLNFKNLDQGEGLPERDEYEFEFFATDSTASSTASVEIGEEDPDVSFSDDSITEIGAGDVAELTFTLEEAQDAFVQVGGPDVDFIDILYVEAENPAEPVTIRMNTRVMGANETTADAYQDTENVETLKSANHDGFDAVQSEQTEAVTSDDSQNALLVDADGNDFNSGANEYAAYLEEAGILDDANPGTADDDFIGQAQLDRPLQPAEYDITFGADVSGSDGVFEADSDSTTALNRMDGTILTLNTPQLTGVTAYTAPAADADDEDNIDDITGNLTTERETIAVDDRLVIEAEATGLYGTLVNETSNSTGGADGYDILDNEEVLPLSALGNATEFENTNLGDQGISVTVEADAAVGNQDPTEIDFTNQDTSEGAVLVDHEESTLYIIVDTTEDDAFSSGNPEAGQSYTAEVEYDADTDDDRYEFQTQGSDELAEGAFDSASGSSLFPYFTDDETESVTTTFDLEERSITFDNLNEDRVVQAQASEQAEISGETNVAPGSDAEIELRSTAASTSFNTGTEVEITEDGSVTGTFDLSSQEVGDQFNANLRIDGEQVDSNEAIVVEAISDEEPAETNETEPADDGEEEPADDGEEPADDGSADDGSTDDGTPGFGAVVALIALIGAALLAVRRQN